VSQIQLSVSAFLCVELVAGALLALWVAVRFPSFGPKALRPAMALMLVAMFLIRAVSFSIHPLLHVPNGIYLVLFGCLLPSVFGAFLAAAWLMRLLASQVGGSGGGGHRVPSSS
jgi:hypothetical protein